MRLGFGRRALGLVGLVGLAAGVLAGVPAALAPQSAGAAAPTISVYAGYVVNDGDGPVFVPSPWSGATNTTFVGQATSNNAAAIRIDNSSASALSVADVSVDTGAARYDLWGANLSVPANGSLILTGTTVSTNGSGGNFDLSNTYGCPAPASLPVPFVTVTVAGVATSYRDSNQVLNDTARCTSGVEGQAWTALGVAKHGAELFGESNPAEGGVAPLEAGARVNGFSGNLSQSATDLALPGRGRALSWSRTYNALDAATATGPGALGWGWTDSYAESLSIDAPSGNVVVHQANNSTAAFYASGALFVAASAQINATLVKNADATYNLTRADQSTDTFSSAGVLISQTDRNGYVTTLAYSGGRLATVTDPAGRTLSVSYNGANQLASVADSTGRRVSYGYDGAGNLATVTDRAGGITRYGYDSAHRLTSVSDVRNATTTTAYDAANRVTSQTDPLNRVTTFSYGPTSTTVGRPAGTVAVQTYDSNANLSALTQGAGTPQAATWSYGYDQANNRISVTDPNNHVTSATYDSRANQLSRTDALGRKTTWSYDAANDPTSVTDPAGLVTSFSYNTRNNLSGVSRVLAPTNQVVATNLTYSDSAHPGDLSAMSDPLGSVWHYSYDNVGNRTAVTDPLGNATTYAFNATGSLATVTSARGYTSSYTYDALGDATSVTDPLGHVTSATYDAAANRTSLTDADNHTTTYSFDADSELTQTRRPDNSVWTTGWDPNANMISQGDGLGQLTTFTYNPLDRLTTTADPLHRQSTISYDPAGNRIALVDPAGQTTSYAYDAANQLTSVTYSDGTTPKVTYAYDPAGRRTSMTDATGTSTYTYDNLGRLSAWTQGPGNRVGYGYDLDGRVTNMTYPNAGQTVTRQYDNDGRLSAVGDWLGHTTTFGYDPDGNLTTEARPDNSVATSTYDSADRLTLINDVGPNGTILNLPYTLDPAGLVTSANQVATTPAATQTMAYDQANRLTSAQGSSPAATSNAYTYDAGDTITALSATVSLTHDVADQPVAATNATTNKSTTFTYDSRGNRIRTVDGLGNTTTYGYDQANRLSFYIGPLYNAINNQVGTNQGQIAIRYDGDGLRADLGWDRTQGLPLILTQQGVSFLYGPGGMVIEQVSGTGLTGTPTYFHHDRMGNTRALTDQAARALNTYAYDPYGNLTESVGTTSNPFLFAGQYTDPQTGLIFMRSRYYDPTSAQFLSRNPVVSASPLEPYGYAGWSPSNAADPSGLTSGWSATVSGRSAFWQDRAGVVDPSGLAPGAGLRSGSGSAPGLSAASLACGPAFRFGVIGPVTPSGGSAPSLLAPAGCPTPGAS